jgi:hypothetical protein
MGRIARRLQPHVLRALLIASGVVLLASLFRGLGPGRILSLLSSLGVNFLVVVLIFSAHEVVRSLAVRLCLRVDPRPPLTEVLRIRFLGEAAGALTRTGPFAAEPARAWLLGSRGGQGLPGYAAAVGELIANSGTSATVNVVVTGWALSSSFFTGPLVVVAHVLFWGSLVHAGVVVSAVASRVRVLGACARLAGSLPFVGRRVRIDPAKVRQVEDAISFTLRGRSTALAGIVLLEITAQALLVCEGYWALRSMGIHVSLRSALLIEVMTRAVNVVQFVGTSEAGFAVIFTWLGLPAAVGFTLSLVQALRSLAAAGIGVSLLTAVKWWRTGPAARSRGAMRRDDFISFAAERCNPVVDGRE